LPSKVRLDERIAASVDLRRADDVVRSDIVSCGTGFADEFSAANDDDPLKVG